MSDSSRKNPTQPEFKKPKIGWKKAKRVEFSDLTNDAIGMIIDKLELKERLKLRKVSRRFRTLVDQKRSILKYLSVACDVDNVHVTYNNNMIVYGHPNGDSHQYKKMSKVMTSGNFMKIALADLKFVLKDPTVELDELVVDYFHRYYRGTGSIHSHAQNFFVELKNLLKSLDHKISVRKIEIDAHCSYNTLAVLPYLKPGTLEVIDFGFIEYKDAEKAQIVNTEQWKQAKELIFINDEDVWAEEHLMHFKRFSMNKEEMDLKDILKWRDFFSKSPNFEFAEVYTDCAFRPRDVQNHLGDVISSEVEDRQLMYIIHHPMLTDSTQILEMKVKPRHGQMSFKKITRPSS